MPPGDSLDQQVFILSFYDYADYDSAEHILGFYSTQTRLEREKASIKSKGFNVEFHTALREIWKIIEGAAKSNRGGETGYGEPYREGLEYPWSHCYTSVDEIVRRINQPARYQHFLPKSSGQQRTDTSGYDGWLRIE